MVEAAPIHSCQISGEVGRGTALVLLIHLPGWLSCGGRERMLVWGGVERMLVVAKDLCCPEAHVWRSFCTHAMNHLHVSLNVCGWRTGHVVKCTLRTIQFWSLSAAEVLAHISKKWWAWSSKGQVDTDWLYMHIKLSTYCLRERWREIWKFTLVTNIQL